MPKSFYGSGRKTPQRCYVIRKTETTGVQDNNYLLSWTHVHLAAVKTKVIKKEAMSKNLAHGSGDFCNRDMS